MLWKTYDTFRDRLQYTKEKDGSWSAEFDGRFHVRVEDPSLEGCRHRALDELDGQLAAWIASPATKDDRKKTERKQRKN